MKHLLLLLLLAAMPLAAQNKTILYEFAPLTATGDTNEISVMVGRSVATYHTISVRPVTAGTCTYTVEGTIDAIDDIADEYWADLSGTQSCTANAMIHIINRPVTSLRISVNTFSGTSVRFGYLGVAE